MIENIDKIIRKYDTIIIHRHLNPDMDAIGSQVGLKELIKVNYPEKKVRVVGDQNRFDYENQMEEVSDEDYKEALAIIVDVAVSKLVSDNRYELAKEVLVIDHHQNDCDIENSTVYSDTSYSSAAEYISDIFLSLDYEFSEKAASYLFSGMVTDTGRFQWMKVPERVFMIASILVGYGAKTTEFYNWLYTEPLSVRLMKQDFQSRIVYEDGIAYLKNDLDVFEKYNVDFFSISRGFANLAAGIDEIQIWLNFTINPATGLIVGEFRSRQIPIVDVAKSYGGGGHLNACGATLSSWEEVDKIIKDFKNLLKENMDD